MKIVSACLKYSDAKTIKSRKGCGSRFFMLGALALGVDPASRFSLVGADATSTPDFKSLRVKDLQNKLKERGLPISGRKAELIERLSA